MKGRPRLYGVPRRKDGRVKDAVTEVHPESLAARDRILIADGIILTFGKIELGREIIKRTADDRLSGFSLGRLLLRHRQGDPFSISEAQFETAEKWKEIVLAEARLDGLKMTIHSPSFVMGSMGYSVTDIEEEKIRNIREKWRAATSALEGAARENGMRLRDVLCGIVLEDWPLGTLVPSDYGLIRIGLNAIGRVL